MHTCSMCGRQFESRRGLSAHLARARQRAVTCPKCGEQTHSVSHYRDFDGKGTPAKSYCHEVYVGLFGFVNVVRSCLVKGERR